MRPLLVRAWRYSTILSDQNPISSLRRSTSICTDGKRGENSEPDFIVLRSEQVFNVAAPVSGTLVPMHSRALAWSDLVQGAYQLKPLLHISQSNWVEAVQAVGREGDAVCLLLTVQALVRGMVPLKTRGPFSCHASRGALRRTKSARSDFWIAENWIVKRTTASLDSFDYL